MNIEIHALTPARVEDYLRFFDETPHSTGKDEHKCYCVCWSAADSANADFSSADKRRALARAYVKSGKIKGYLAYADGRVIGWCNANARNDCTQSISWTMFMKDIKRDAEKVKSVFCFAVAPAWRGQGVAGLLLARVLADAEKEGFCAVEAYPNRTFVNAEDDFMGPRRLFEKHGFTALYEAGNRTVMRKTLNAARGEEA